MTFIHPTHTHTLLSAHRESLQLANRLANTHYTPTALPAKSTRHHAMPPPQSPLLILNTHGTNPQLNQENSQNAAFRQSKNASYRPRRRLQSGTSTRALTPDTFPPPAHNPPRPPAAPTSRARPRLISTTTSNSSVPVSWLRPLASNPAPDFLPAWQAWREVVAPSPHALTPHHYPLMPYHSGLLDSGTT